MSDDLKNDNHPRPLIDQWLAGLPVDAAENLREAYEERAAVFEFDAGMPRQCAEYAALAMLARTHPLQLQGLHLARLASGQYALAHDMNLLPTVDHADPIPADLRTVLDDLGPVVLLTPLTPKN